MPVSELEKNAERIISKKRNIRSVVMGVSLNFAFPVVCAIMKSVFYLRICSRTNLLPKKPSIKKLNPQRVHLLAVSPLQP